MVMDDLINGMLNYACQMYDQHSKFGISSADKRVIKREIYDTIRKNNSSSITPWDIASKVTNIVASHGVRNDPTFDSNNFNKEYFKKLSE